MMDDPLKYGLTHTMRTIIKNVPAEELDRLLSEAYPQFLRTDEEMCNSARQLLEELNAKVLPKPLIPIEEALRRTREDDFSDE